MRLFRRVLAVTVSTVTLAAGLTMVTSTMASAAESVPTLQYPATSVDRYKNLVSSPTGSITLPCNTLDNGADLITYSSAGAVTRRLNHTQLADGVTNCINKVIVDKNDVIYGIPDGKDAAGNYVRGQYLYAYAGNVQKWKYPVSCSSSQGSSYAVGANGIIYATTWMGNGLHLIGLKPELTVGQTQPAKVFDVKIPDDCSIELFSYKDGLMLRGQNSGFRYYSYGGKLLACPSVAQFWDAKLNAAGQLFDSKLVSGNNTSVNVTRYDPTTGQLAWTTPASTPGANVQSVSLYPVATGGVVALIREQKMVSPSVPATPTEYVYALTTLNASGQKVGATIQLPGSNSQGTFGNIYAVPSGDGKLAMVRDMQMNTGLSYPTTASALQISVFNPATGGWSYQQVMSGDMQKPGGPSGFTLDYTTIATTTNAVNFIAKCSGNCDNLNRRLYSVRVSGLGMDYPRGAVVATSPRPAAPYIALGDSFSSGEGIPPFEAKTNIPSVNMCHRSELAYPQLIAGSSPTIPALGTGAFRACSGAVTDNVWNAAQVNEGIQLDWWPDNTVQVVTLTIGGNDIGFATFAEKCVLTTCEIGSAHYNEVLSKINNELPSKLEVTYRKILQYTPNAEIHVIGYPQVVDYKSPTEPNDSRCFYLQDGGTKWADARAARDIVAKLNNKISATVTTLRAENVTNLRLHYVPMDGASSPFNGHEVCGSASSSWFQNLDTATSNKAYVFHPNAEGQEGYATVVGSAINAG